MQIEDEYARTFMEGEGSALYFDKRSLPARGRLFMCASALAGLVAIGVVATEHPATIVAVVPFLCAFVLTTSTWSLRTVVTKTAIHIQYGVFRPRIPAADVESAAVVRSQGLGFGGWGIRRNPLTGETSYSMLGDHGVAVKIKYKEKEKTRTILVSTADPERLCQAIAQARKGTADDALSDARSLFGLAPAPSSDTGLRVNGKNLVENAVVEPAVVQTSSPEPRATRRR